MNPQPITFRFGLTGRRWGDHGPVVLLQGLPMEHALLYA
jgi:hypothetical protein